MIEDREGNEEIQDKGADIEAGKGLLGQGEQGQDKSTYGMQIKERSEQTI